MAVTKSSDEKRVNHTCNKTGLFADELPLPHLHPDLVNKSMFEI